MKDMPLFETSMPSPLGRLRVIASDDGLVGVYLPDQRGVPPLDAEIVERHPLLDRAVTQLGEYFAGARRTFELSLAPRGTDMQRLVWGALARIPFGARRSYGELAQAIGRPRAARAVGAANARNPLSVIVPCHRVIGATGGLTGYAGGLHAKRWLLDHEARLLTPTG
jgi:methylated-DNA-[protein]-cysteine S-methyltransferase